MASLDQLAVEHIKSKSTSPKPSTPLPEVIICCKDLSLRVSGVGWVPYKPDEKVDDGSWWL